MSRTNPSTNYVTPDISVDLEKEFYNKKFYFSYSSLQKLMYSPRLFYNHYILDQKEERLESHLLDGKVIHCLLLDNGSFEKLFIVSPVKIPVGNNKQIVDKLFYLARQAKRVADTLTDFQSEIIDMLKDINLHQTLKTDAQRLEKILCEENINYYEYLKQKGTRDVIDDETLVRCKDSVLTLSTTAKVRQLLHLDGGDKVEIYNETAFQVEPSKYQFGFKGIIDNLIVDRINKIVYINDLKTSGKSLAEFTESIEYFKYYIQAAIYMFLVAKTFNIDSTWKIVFNFIVIDKYQQVYCFEVSKPTMKLWTNKLRETFEMANWHYTNKDFSLPYAFSVGQVIL